MKVLVACEFSGVVRRAFRERGHDAFSCDLAPSLDGSPHHITGDCLPLLDGSWDLVIAHPPCTCLSGAGAWLARGRLPAVEAAFDFVCEIAFRGGSRLCIENPAGFLTKMLRPPDQYVHPFQFGDAFKKRTGLWLRGLPRLVPTHELVDGARWVDLVPPGPDRRAIRSVFFSGMAAAMADQWGQL